MANGCEFRSPSTLAYLSHTIRDPRYTSTIFITELDSTNIVLTILTPTLYFECFINLVTNNIEDKYGKKEEKLN